MPLELPDIPDPIITKTWYPNQDIFVDQANQIVYCKNSELGELFNNPPSGEWTLVGESYDVGLHIYKDHYRVHSNCHETSYYLNEIPKCFRRIFGVNFNLPKRIATSLPIGIECIDKLKYYNKYIEKDKLLYINFNVETNPSERNPIYQSKNFQWATIERPNSRDEKNYFRQLNRHKFILSPEGNGVDCHRTWESLYYGAIPIVKNSYLTRQFADFLPILCVDNYLIITKEFLEDLYSQIEKTQFDYRPLSRKYWDDLIYENIRH